MPVDQDQCAGITARKDPQWEVSFARAWEIDCMVPSETRSPRKLEGRSECALRIGQIPLLGTLALPEATKGIVLFAHGSGSSQFSLRNNMVAYRLQDAGIATILFDLLTGAEAASRKNVFYIPLLAQRLAIATTRIGENDQTCALPIGHFGASMGAAAALITAIRSSRPIAAIVSRSGRPDLAWSVLSLVRSPTLLIVGGNDSDVLEPNRAALERILGVKALEVVPGATHLLEEPGALEQVIRLAEKWFSDHFRTIT